MTPTREQLEIIRDSLDWVADARTTLDDALGELHEEARRAGFDEETIADLAAAAVPGVNPAAAAVQKVFGIDIGFGPPEEDEETGEEKPAGDGAEDEEPDKEPEETEPAGPTEEQLDAIRDEMQSVCDAQTDWDIATADLYKAAEKAGVSEEFADAAIDAVKDGRAGEDVDEAFELAREEM